LTNEFFEVVSDRVYLLRGPSSISGGLKLPILPRRKELVCGNMVFPPRNSGQSEGFAFNRFLLADWEPFHFPEVNRKYAGKYRKCRLRRRRTSQCDALTRNSCGASER